MVEKSKKLIEIARQTRVIVERAKTDLGEDLSGFSMLDLVADQIPDVPLSTLKESLIVAGYGKGNPGPKKTKAEHKREAKKAQKPVKLRMSINKGKALPRGMFIWSVWIEAEEGLGQRHELAAGSVEAQTKPAAVKKAKALLRKRYNILTK